MYETKSKQEWNGHNMIFLYTKGCSALWTLFNYLSFKFWQRFEFRICVFFFDEFVVRVTRLVTEHSMYLSPPSPLVRLLSLWGLKIKCRGLEDGPIALQIAQNRWKMRKICPSKTLGDKKWGKKNFHTHGIPWKFTCHLKSKSYKMINHTHSHHQDGWKKQPPMFSK
jgi:hypothetical protein